MFIFSCRLISTLPVVFPTIHCSYVFFNILSLNTAVVFIYLSNFLAKSAAALLVGKNQVLSEILFLPTALT